MKSPLVKFSYCDMVYKSKLKNISSVEVSRGLGFDIATLPDISSYEEVECDIKEGWIAFLNIKVSSNSELIVAIDYYLQTILSEGELNVNDFIGTFLPGIRRDYVRIVRYVDQAAFKKPYMNYMWNQTFPAQLYDTCGPTNTFLFMNDAGRSKFYFDCEPSVTIVAPEGIELEHTTILGRLSFDFELFCFFDQDEERPGIYNIKIAGKYDPGYILNTLVRSLNEEIQFSAERLAEHL